MSWNENRGGERNGSDGEQENAFHSSFPSCPPNWGGLFELGTFLILAISIKPRQGLKRRSKTSERCTLLVYTVQRMAREPKIRLDPSSPLPAYRQIVDGLRTLLVEGALEPGNRLPPVRRLAMELGVHFNTVGEAYRELATEGWLDVRHGSGATVRERAQPAPVSPERLAEFRGRLRNLVTQMRAAGLPAARIAAELRSATEILK